MLVTNKPLATLTAADLMSRELIVIPQHMCMRTAARLLSGACVSGAPVIDCHGSCLGVISANDFVRWARQEEPAAWPSRPSACVCSDWQVVETEGLPAEAVSRYMTHDPVTALTSTQAPALARMMLDAHIHRVIITDEDRRPVGIVSSTDVLAAVARLEYD